MSERGLRSGGHRVDVQRLAGSSGVRLRLRLIRVRRWGCCSWCRGGCRSRRPRLAFLHVLRQRFAFLELASLRWRSSTCSLPCVDAGYDGRLWLLWLMKRRHHEIRRDSIPTRIDLPSQAASRTAILWRPTRVSKVATSPASPPSSAPTSNRGAHASSSSWSWSWSPTSAPPSSPRSRRNTANGRSVGRSS